MKKLLFKFPVLAFVLVFLLLYTCQKDDTVVDSVQSDGQQFKIEILNENNLRENNSLSAKITQIKRSFESKQGSNSSARERFGFHVNTDSIKYIEELGTGKHSYNFPMSADSLGRVRNFVLASQGNGQYDSHVVTYGFTESEYSTLDEQALSKRYTSFSRSMDIDSLIQEGPSYMEKVLAPGYQCAEVWQLSVDFVPPCGGNNCGHDHGGEAWIAVYQWVLVASECWPTGGGSTGNGEDPGSGDNGGSHGNTNPHPGAPGNNVVAPTFCRGCPEIDVEEGENEDCIDSLQLASLINGLSPNPQQTFFLMNPDNCASASLIYSFWNYGGDETFITELLNIVMEDGQVDSNALGFMLEAQSQNKIFNDIDDDFLISVNQFMAIDTSDAELHDPITIHLLMKMALIKATQPDICVGLSEWQCYLKVFWEASKDIVHVLLDGIGLVPVVGEIADLINGGLYLLEGDGVNATLSFAATVPLAGWTATGAKYAIKIVDATQTATTITTKVKLTWKVVGSTVEFGSSSLLRKVLGITDSALQAHHLIPWATRNHDVVQKAAKSGSAFHMNEALNGIAVASWRNQPNHNAYNDLINSKLDNFNTSNPNATVDEAYDFVSDLISDIRDWVINNPNSHLNDLILP